MQVCVVRLVVINLALVSTLCGDAVPDGKATAKLPDSSVYIGEFKGGLFNGRGTLTRRNGEVYKGEFKDGLMHGQGTVSNRIYMYVGGFSNGLFHGKGVLIQRNGDRYEGEFEDNAFNGKGVRTRKNGDQFEGEFKDGLAQGRGIITYASGDRYEGEFVDNNFCGKGVLTRKNGDRYEGEFKESSFNGQGTLIYGTGDVYKGEFKDGVFDGKGVFTYNNGRIMEGLWERGRYKSKSPEHRLQSGIVSQKVSDKASESMKISVIAGLLPLLIVALIIVIVCRKMAEHKGSVLADIPFHTRKKARIAMIVVGTVSIVAAVMGLWCNFTTLFTDFSGIVKEQNIPYFYPAFYTMSYICIVCYACLLICGVQFLRLRTNLFKLFVGIIIFEVLYFFSVFALCMILQIGTSVAAAVGVAFGGMSLQKLTLFPLWAPFLAGWAVKRIAKP